MYPMEDSVNNYDLNNYQEFDGLLSEVMERFQKHKLLSVYS